MHITLNIQCLARRLTLIVDPLHPRANNLPATSSDNALAHPNGDTPLGLPSFPTSLALEPRVSEHLARIRRQVRSMLGTRNTGASLVSGIKELLPNSVSPPASQE
jgi:hypothetical protein